MCLQADKQSPLVSAFREADQLSTGVSDLPVGAKPSTAADNQPAQHVVASCSFLQDANPVAMHHPCMPSLLPVDLGVVKRGQARPQPHAVHYCLEARVPCTGVLMLFMRLNRASVFD